ncbi:MAG: 30S ribosomal protein S20 [Clostridiales bacterium]|nr:30S ribosomal protein S20 [Clostridiales bacterium]
MANIKSAKKRIKVIQKKTLRNRIVKSSTKTAVKKVRAALAQGDKSNTEEAFRNAVSAIDKAVSKGVYHKNTAARKKSRLAKRIHKIA